eukprot:UN22471
MEQTGSFSNLMLGDFFHCPNSKRRIVTRQKLLAFTKFSERFLELIELFCCKSSYQRRWFNHHVTDVREIEIFVVFGGTPISQIFSLRNFPIVRQALLQKARSSIFHPFF